MLGLGAKLHDYGKTLIFSPDNTDTETSGARLTLGLEMTDPDDPRLQQECADRLMAYAARRRAELDMEPPANTEADEPEPEREAA